MLLMTFAAILVVCIFCVEASDNPVSTVEMNALEDLYDSTDGPNWNIGINGVPWVFTTGPVVQNPCVDPVWYGLTCNNDALAQENNIVKIQLPSSNLVGSIPNSISKFPFLTHLDLDTNFINGTIPSGVGALTSLMYLILNNNSMTGAIPTAIGGIDSLITLSLNSNRLNGTIPSSLGSLQGLVTLGLNDNALTGSIPAELSQLQDIEDFYLYNNQLTGTIPPSLSNWPRVVNFFVNNNNLSGSIPSSLGGWTKAEELYLSGNQMTGSIPASFSGLSNLKQLWLYGNRFTGTVPSFLGSIASLNMILLQNNNFTGTLPPELSDLNLLSIINLSENYLHGTIPAVYGNIPLLLDLYLQGNDLTGTIPAELGGLSALLQMYLSANHLNGTIPASLGQLTHLLQLELGNNSLTGTIPLELTELASLEVLELQNNFLNGSIPDSVSQWGALEILDLYNNSLTGSIPPELFTITSLVNLYIGANQLTSSIPDNLGNATRLEALSLYSNQLTNWLPSSLLSLRSLQILMVFDNLLSGPLPEDIGDLPLVTLYLYQNKFTGSLPVSLGNLHSLTYLLCSDNDFDGSIAPQLMTSRLLTIFTANENSFTGSLPSTIGDSPILSIVQFGDNYLSGSIPPEINKLFYLSSFDVSTNLLSHDIPSFENITSLLSLDLQSNALSGTAPVALSRMAGLTSLYLNDNMLHGSLEGLFNATAQRALQYVALTGNQFTGSVPSQLFLIPTIEVVQMGSNCLSGTLPSAICQASALSTLILDGASSSSACQNTLFTHIPHSTTYSLSAHRMSGSIPACLFGMPLLQTLHLSGNMLTQSIPEMITSTADTIALQDSTFADGVHNMSLVDLSLSHNLLTGTIPAQIQSHLFSSLDLSFNKLTGTLSSEFSAQTANSSVTLQVNRLSGAVPASLIDAQSVNVLDGNLFSCDFLDREASLPSSDPSIDTFQCASNSLDLSMYLFCGVLGAAILVLCVILLLRKGVICSGMMKTIVTKERNTRIYLSNLYIQSTATPIGEFNSLLVNYRAVVTALAAVLFVGLLPTYAVLSMYYSTYQYTYAWQLSGAYLSGEMPGVVLFALWSVVVIAVTILMRHWRLAANDKAQLLLMQHRNSIVEPVNSSVTKNNVWMEYGSLASILLINLAVVVGVNVLYVVATLTAESQEGLTLVKILIAFFKLAWNEGVLSVLFKWHSKRLGSSASDVRPSTTAGAQLLQLRVCIQIFNSIIAPCAATAAVSPNCFYYLLANSPTVTSTALVNICSGVKHQRCYTYVTSSVQTSYLPPFVYSYQCSATLLTNYASIYVYMFLISAFLKPLYFLLLRHLFVQFGKHSKESYRFRLTSWLLPSHWKPSSIDALKRNMLRNRKLLHSERTVLSMVNCVAVLLTFGVVFPLLLVVGLVEVAMGTFVLQILLGRLLTQIDPESDVLMLYLKELNDVTRDATRRLLTSISAVPTTAALFYAMFLFDTLGDKLGWREALWAPLTIIVLPFAVSSVLYLWGRVSVAGQQHGKNSKKQHNSDHNLNSGSGHGGSNSGSSSNLDGIGSGRDDRQSDDFEMRVSSLVNNPIRNSIHNVRNSEDDGVDF